MNLLRKNNQKEEHKIPFLTPANAVVELEKKNEITEKEAKEGLEKIKGLIRRQIYKKAMEDLDKGE